MIVVVVTVTHDRRSITPITVVTTATVDENASGWDELSGIVFAFSSAYASWEGGDRIAGVQRLAHRRDRRGHNF